MPNHDSPGPSTAWARIAAIVGAIFLAQSAYLAVDASPTMFYVANVFAHWFGGIAFTILLLILAVRGLSALGFLGKLAFAVFAASVLAAIVLVRVENTSPNRWILHWHVALATAASVLALFAVARAAGRDGTGTARSASRILTTGAVAAAVILLAGPLIRGYSKDRYVIRNPERPPATMDLEAMGGADGPFFPSSAATSTGGRIPSNFFMTSETCARCHSDIYEQWKSSAHHFSSFNNQWYRKSIEYMQNVSTLESSRWCAGCHDHAVLFNGLMDQPLATFLATQEAHTGVSCNSCHAITHVKDTMGNGGFFIEYPPLHDLAVSENPALRWLHDESVKLDPGPHKEVFLKPFHREQTSEFCASCHKVHLDEPVNHYRWLRGFNEYDNWQASGVSGEGARSFYYPPEPMDCADCHMPLVASDDKGNLDGYVHSHSFFAANTALPMANLDETQMAGTIEFLQRNQVTVDLFAAGPARALQVAAVDVEDLKLASTFAVGEESGMTVGRGAGNNSSRDIAPIWGPLKEQPVTVRRGDEVRIDVVTRTRGVGHFFPGGTVDAHEVWLELRATDETGRTLFWSGVVHDGGEGIVDPGAQNFRARMVDARGNPIDRRNAFHTRAVAWVNLIPPGAADVSHYRLQVPADCGDEIRVEARLNYRKFTHANTEFSFKGRPAPGEPAAAGPGIDRVGVHHDDREFVFTDVPIDVSAEVREMPNLPIVVMSLDNATLAVVDAGTDVSNPQASGNPKNAMRWNDYGIGLLRQSDLQGAKRAFSATVEGDPRYADGYVNLARVALREGLLEEAATNLDEALSLEPNLAKSHYFLGLVHKERGEYDAALANFRVAAEQYPRDRVVRNDIARVLFLKREYTAAVAELQEVLAVDAEDLVAHYNLMLCYKGLGRTEEAEAERHLYERFKADEDANAILGPFLRENPEDNRMRQPIHEQRSAPRDVIERELALRAANGDPHTVLPGQGAEYAKRIVERGRALIEAGHGSQRHLGPIEAEAIVNVDPSAPRKPVTTTLPAAATEAKTAAVENPISERGTE
jgi:tetratricopeptide (TPR) repeat protein